MGFFLHDYLMSDIVAKRKAIRKTEAHEFAERIS
jgi:hypothetical protein